MLLYGTNAPNFCVSFFYICFVPWCVEVKFGRIHIKIIRQKMKKWQASTLIFEKFCFIFWNFFHRAVASPVSNVKNWILLDIPKPMIKCCRWCCRINIILLIWVSVVLFFYVSSILGSISFPPLILTMILVSLPIFVY